MNTGIIIFIALVSYLSFKLGEVHATAYHPQEDFFSPKNKKYQKLLKVVKGQKIKTTITSPDKKFKEKQFINTIAEDE